MATRRKSSTKPAAVDRLVDAAIALAAEKRWSAVTFADIAARAGLPPDEAGKAVSGKRALLEALGRRIEKEVAAHLAPDLGDTALPVRERLFDALMTRFEAMQPIKPALRSMLGASVLDPLALLGGARDLHRAMGRTLEAVHLPAKGLSGCLGRKALGVVYLATLKVWLGDDSEDMGPTMAALDRRLGDLDALVRGLCGGRSKSSREEDPAAVI